jgi:hypothetical protein
MGTVVEKSPLQIDAWGKAFRNVAAIDPNSHLIEGEPLAIDPPGG